MKKAVYSIYVTAIENGARVHCTRPQAGYIFDVAGDRYGVARTGGEWAVTDLQSGFLIGTVQRRKDAPEIITEALRAAIREKITAAEIARRGVLYDALQAIKAAG